MLFTSRTLYLTFFAALTALGGTVHEPLMWAGIFLAAAILLTAVAEYLLIPKAESLQAVRIYPKKFSFGSDHAIRLEIQNYSGHKLEIQVLDEPPAEFGLRDVKFETALPDREKDIFAYTVCPRQRGVFQFGRLHIVVGFSYPGLARKHHAYLQPAEIKVYPGYNALRQSDLITLRGKLQTSGVRTVRQIGIGTDYESLREYSPDDEYRRINWKATARLNRMMTTNYQIEKSQNVIVMMDAGRLMGATSLGMSKLDHAVNAAMLLSNQVIKNGDLAGLMIFSNAIHSYLPPKRSKTRLGQIADQLSVVKSDFHESDYFAAFEFIKTKCHRRSLIVLFSEIIDDHSSAMLIGGILRLYPKHLCLCVLMKDRLMEQSVNIRVNRPKDAYRKAVAAEWLAERDDAIAGLKSKGVLVVDTLPEQLTADLMNAYLKVKMRSMI